MFFSLAQSLALGMPGLGEWIVIGVIAVLLFGKRLPEVGKSLGKGIVEFKKGLRGIEDEIDVQATATPPAQAVLPAAHRFDPYTGQPLAGPETVSAAPQKFDPFTGKPLEHAETVNQSVSVGAEEHHG